MNTNVVKEKGRKFNFNLEDLIANGISEKKEVTYRSLSRYLSIPEERKEAIISEALSESPMTTFSERKEIRKKRKLKRL